MGEVYFSDLQESKKFYESRYSDGYMGYWSDFEKNRMKELIRELKLPASGKALDYGCGRGIFTGLIRDCLPGWEIYGCDISAEAVRFATATQSGMQFSVIGDGSLSGIKFDFIHTHHVLEHVFNLEETIENLCSLSATSCAMIHTVPCCQPGSLEYKISAMREGGIHPTSGKFFFEDEAHLRRLTEEQAIGLFRPFGFKKEKSYFANRLHGAYLWMAESTLGLVKNFTDPGPVKQPDNKRYVRALRKRMLFNWFCVYVAGAYRQGDRGPNWMLKKVLRMIAFLFLFWLVIPVERQLRRAAIAEWDQEREVPKGSELFLLLRKKS